MRPLKLELAGFGCFRELAEVSFEELNLFAIAGPTGSGKSTLLDAITYALYGKTPRLGSTGLDVLISPGIDQLQVTLVFELPSSNVSSSGVSRVDVSGGDVSSGEASAGAVYRVGRTLHRGKSRTESQARLEVQDSHQAGKWNRVPDTEKVRALNDKVSQLVGLDYDGFTRAVLLPQGAFDEFLRGNASARRNLLINLLGIDKLEKMQKRAGEIAKEAKNARNNIETRLAEDYAGATPERLEELAVAKRHYEVEREQHQADLERLSRELQALYDLKTLSESLAKAQKEHAQFDAQADVHEEDKKQLERAERAARLRPQWQLLKQRQDDLSGSQHTLDALTSKQQTAQQAFNQAETSLSSAQQDAKAVSDIDQQLRDVAAAQGLLEQLSAKGGSLEDASYAQDDIIYSEQGWQAQQDVASFVPQLERLERDLARTQQQLHAQQQAFEQAQQAFNQAETSLSNAQQDAAAVSDIDQQLQDVAAAQGLREQLSARGGNLTDVEHVQDDITYSEQDWQAQQTLSAYLPQLARAERDVQDAKQALEATVTSLATTDKTLEQQRNLLSALEQQGKDAKVQLDALSEQLNAAKIANEAAALRVHLHEGEPCPVCEQIVQTLPPTHAAADIAALTKQQQAAQNNVNTMRDTYTDKRNDIRLTEKSAEDLHTQHIRQQETLKTAQDALAEQQKPFANVANVLAEVTAEAAKTALEQRQRALLGSLAQSILQKTNGEDPKQLAEDLAERKKTLEHTLSTAQEAFNKAQRDFDKASDQLEQSKRNQTQQQQTLADARADVQRQLAQHAAVMTLELTDDAPAQDVKTALEQQRRALLGSLAQSILAKTKGADPQTLAKDLNDRKKQLEQTLKSAQDNHAAAQRELDKLTTQLEQQRDYQQRYQTALQEAQESLEEALRDADFADVAALEAALLPDQALRDLRERVKQVAEDITRLARRIADLQTQLAGRTFDLAHYQEAQTAKETASEALAESQKNLGAVAQQEDYVRQQLERAASLRDQLPNLDKRISVYDRISQDLRSNNFQDFVIVRVQKQLAVRASDIIREVSDGRYDLRLIDGEYHVIDAWNAGASRSTKTLSGGETFIASLALALALSDTVASGVSLGALFLDEGFGTLDSESLEAVTQVLEHLSAEGRIVGIITHVKELTERLPERLIVQKGPEGSTLRWD